MLAEALPSPRKTMTMIFCLLTYFGREVHKNFASKTNTLLESQEDKKPSSAVALLSRPAIGVWRGKEQINKCYDKPIGPRIPDARLLLRLAVTSIFNSPKHRYSRNHFS